MIIKEKDMKYKRTKIFFILDIFCACIMTIDAGFEIGQGKSMAGILSLAIAILGYSSAYGEARKFKNWRD